MQCRMHVYKFHRARRAPSFLQCCVGVFFVCRPYCLCLRLSLRALVLSCCRYSGVFPSLNMAVKRREQALQDYKRLQSKVEKYEEKEKTGPVMVKLHQVPQSLKKHTSAHVSVHSSALPLSAEEQSSLALTWFFLHVL